MSTLDVTCNQCAKTFRVRAEFAGKSTRCPGCSAPITISGSRPAPPTTPPRTEERPRPRPRRRDDEDNEPRRPPQNWASVDMAFRREQVAVVFVLIGVLCDYFAFCLGQSMGPSGRNEGAFVALGLLLVIGPALAAAAFGIMARIAALRPPPETKARTSAVASLLCGLAGLASLVLIALASLMSIDAQRPNDLPVAVAIGGLMLATLGSVGTFVAYVMQIGIYRRSAAMSAAVGRLAVAVCVCVLSLLGIAVLYMLVSEMTTPNNSPYGPHGGGSHRPGHERFYEITVFFLFPLALAVVLILYHRLLAAGRQSLQAGPPNNQEELDYDDRALGAGRQTPRGEPTQRDER
jgi:hypothetical protein